MMFVGVGVWTLLQQVVTYVFKASLTFDITPLPLPYKPAIIQDNNPDPRK